MRIKSNKALHRSARLARRAPSSPVVAPPAATSFPRQPWLRVGAANGVAAAVAGILYGSGGAAYGQEAAATTSGPAALQEVVVTATAQGVKKLDASYNIVSASQADIAMANPASTAEIYKLSPGVWPEASGGQTGVNIDVAGFPLGGGDSPYFTTMVQGTPLYGSPALSFMDNSSLFRMDDTIERVEIVQGGTSALFGPAQPGATANFILRTGTDKATGSLGVTYGFEGGGGALERVDVFQSGKLTEGWYGSIGGFYRKSDGVRDPQYPSDIGGQLTATLKHDLDNGSVMFWARTLHDKNQWVADFPYTVVNGTIHTYPGFNQLNSTWNSRQLQNISIADPGCNCLQNDDISDGRGGDLSYFGSELKMAFGNGWSISNNFIFDGGYLNTHAMINNGNPTTLSAYIAGLQSGTLTPAGLTAADVQAVYPDGLAADPNQSVILQQVWLVQKKLTSAIDEFRLNKELFGGNTLTLGVYLAHYTMNDNWSLGGNALTTNVPNASPIILSAVDAAGNQYQVSSPQGIANANGGYNILQNGRATNIAGYLSDSWKIDRWLLDAGARLEHINLTQETSNTSPVQIGSVFDLWDNAVALPNGTFSHGSRTNTRPTFSGGANYEFSDHMSAYVRINNGVLLKNFDDVRCNISGNPPKNGCPNLVPLQTVQNYEFGFKIQNQWTYVDASVYDKEFQGISYTPTDLGGQPIGPASTFGSTSRGGRVVGSVNPFATSDNKPLAAFKITVNGIYENAHYKDFQGCFTYTDINNNKVCGAINGNQLARLPKYQFRITPGDTQDFSWGTLTEQVTYEYIGKRFQDESNLTPLPSYYDFGAGIDARVGESWEIRLLGSNLTNEIGLTEGNARFGGNTVQNNVGMGRSIVGREVNLTAKYFW
jgi:outer membrane receptor protein involved in Fe transport